MTRERALRSWITRRARAPTPDPSIPCLIPEQTEAAKARIAAGLATRKRKPHKCGISPATAERDYTPEQLEFMNAMQAERDRLRRLLTWPEVFSIALRLGYTKASPPRGRKRRTKGG